MSIVQVNGTILTVGDPTVRGAYLTIELEIVGFANVPIQRTHITALWTHKVDRLPLI